MLAAASKVCRYQKYSVSDDFAHSSTAVPLSVNGHEAHGKGYCATREEETYQQLLGKGTTITYPKTIHKVENTPGDYNIVVDGNEQRNDT